MNRLIALGTRLGRRLRPFIVGTFALGVLAAGIASIPAVERRPELAPKPAPEVLGRDVAVEGARLDVPVTYYDVVADDPDATVIEPPPDVFDAPLPPIVEINAEPIPAEKKGGIWAVVIGINDYPGRNGDLGSAVNDARDMDLALERFGVPASRRKVLLDGDASSTAITSSIDWLVNHAGPDATVVFFYAGHVRKLSSTTEAILGADGREVTDATVAARLAPLEAEQAWIVMAACYGGGFTETLEPGRVLTAAANANSLAYENGRFGRSYLVQYLIRKAWLEGDVEASVQAAYDFAFEQISRAYPNRLPFQVDEAGFDIRLAADDHERGAPEPSTTARPAPAPEKQSPSPPPPEEPADEPKKKAPPPEDDERPCSITGTLTFNC